MQTQRRADQGHARRYWLTPHPSGDFRSLSAWAAARPAALDAAVSGAVCGAGRCNATVALNNTSPDVVAFWTKLALVDDCGAGCAATYAPPHIEKLRRKPGFWNPRRRPA